MVNDENINLIILTRESKRDDIDDDSRALIEQTIPDSLREIFSEFGLNDNTEDFIESNIKTNTNYFTMEVTGFNETNKMFVTDIRWKCSVVINIIDEYKNKYIYELIKKIMENNIGIIGIIFGYKNEVYIHYDQNNDISDHNWILEEFTKLHMNNIMM